MKRMLCWATAERSTKALGRALDSAAAARASTARESASALGVRRRVVKHEMVVESRLVRLGEILTMELYVGRGLDSRLGHRYLQLVGADRDSAQRHEGQVAADETFLDRAELRLVVFDVDIDVLQLADLLAVAIDQHLAVPLGDVPLRLTLVLGHVEASSGDCHARSLSTLVRCGLPSSRSITPAGYSQAAS